MLGLSGPLWVDSGEFPRVPFVLDWPTLPGPIGGAVPVGLAATLTLAAIGIRWRILMAASLVVLGFSVGGDQDRLQPWAYQYALLALALVATPPATAVRLGRWLAISLYFHSALSKLDASFVAELGRTLLDAALGLAGRSSAAWPGPIRAAAILAMPIGELAVAVGLAVPKTRRFALVGLVGLHGALLAILGPWALGHSPNVLAWNVAMIAEGWILFGRVDPGEDARTAPIGPAGWATSIVLAGTIAWPFGERSGFCDPWPAHALYASHADRADVFVHEDDADALPPSIRAHLGPTGLDPWRRLDLTAWSRSARGTPVYPGGRVASGIAEALASRVGLVRPIRLVIWSRADRWTGARARREAVGRLAIRAEADRFRVNAHPAPGRPVGP